MLRPPTIVALLAVAIAGCAKKAPPADSTVPSPSAAASSVAVASAVEPRSSASPRANPDGSGPSQAQLDRKYRSKAIIAEMGLPWLERLPVIEDEASIRPRSLDELTARCLALEIVAVKGESNDARLADHMAASYAASSFFSPREAAFMDDPHPSKRELLEYRWRYEGAHVLLWALGYVAALNPPSTVADVGKEAAMIGERDAARFSADAKPRPLGEILDQADLYYRIHWAVIELRLQGRKSERADEEIVDERHRALNWLVKYMNQAWDDVATDT